MKEVTLPVFLSTEEGRDGRFDARSAVETVIAFARNHLIRSWFWSRLGFAIMVETRSPSNGEERNGPG